MSDPTRADLIGALARAYCTDRNKDKATDPDLVADMADEVLKLLSPPTETRGEEAARLRKEVRRGFTGSPE